jgi:hypothetical protein
VLAALAGHGVLIDSSPSCLCLRGSLGVSCWQLKLSVAVQRACVCLEGSLSLPGWKFAYCAVLGCGQVVARPVTVLC